MLYIDTSVIVPLVLVEADSARITAWLDARLEPLYVGRLAIAEAGSAISRRRRLRELSDEDGERAMAALDDWLAAATTIIDHEPADIIQAGQMVRRPTPKLLAPDAIHLATCRRLGCRMVTEDDELTAVIDVLGIDWAKPTQQP